MTAADAIRDFLAPLLPGWRLQYGRWTDGTRTDRYAVLRSVGGLPASLVRQPQFTLQLIAASTDGNEVPIEASDTVIQAMRSDSGALVLMQPAEPVFWATDDGRPASEIAISAITP